MKIITFNTPTAGHVDPSLAVVRELITRGHEVIYYLTEGYRERVERAGASFRPTPTVEDDYFTELSKQLNPLRLGTTLLRTTHKLLDTLVAEVQARQPTFILYDSMCPWGHLAARQAGIPAVCSMALIQMGPEYILKGRQVGRFLGMMPRLLRWLGRYRTAVKDFAREHNLSISLDQILNNPAPITIHYTSPEFYPPPADGQQHLYVGPAIDEQQQQQIPFPFEQLDNTLPLIYISLGTVFNHNPTFFRACIDAFKGQDRQVVISLGKNLPVTALGELPSNVLVRDYVPQLAILQRANLYITHGGANSAHQALYCGVPMLFAPQQLEQALIAARLAELGTGLFLKDTSPAAILEKADRVLSQPAYQKRVNALATTFKATGGVTGAVDYLEQYTFYSTQ